ncbi:hypothetical protein BN7_4482 [Wickerhamomyces ciferrii]|uniref:F-box domain-containing protein n=1 Tax=Wickerhamomyces ciferrii (strain ATCC 14091 / BCRC 22168 / CBS 111 / JCM 3599 / NBRC 0793 / NRRL Y-1031 F-60-10) TaxID=1206466 RepID=K0KUR1_WICCF|nr:uncharacterized protein BN7_4482 [Wickerhamomyces ciferrii]CCH44913.1 hypothetical protein BN7_4482 [Wickerhamomyces ciferrii]
MNDGQTDASRPPKRPLDQDEEQSKHIKRTKTTILSLPNECLRRITRHLSQKDTLSLLYSNSHFERSCKARLYRKIILSEYPMYDLKELAEKKKITMVSSGIMMLSGGKILKFFEMFHNNRKQGVNPDLAKYVEEIITYEHFEKDPGVSTIYSMMSEMRFKKYMRNVWNDVLSSFMDLEVFIAPRLPLEKLFQLNNHILSNLQKISICIEGNNTYGISRYNVELPNLKVLKLYTLPIDNKVYRSKASIERLLMVAELLISNGSTNNTNLEELELNGSFRSHDMKTRKNFQGLKDNGSDLMQSYISGFKSAALGRCQNLKPYYTSNNLDYASDNEPFYDRSDDEADEEGENEDDHDEIFDDLVSKYGAMDRRGRSIQKEVYINEAWKFNSDNLKDTLYGLRNAYFQYPQFENDIKRSEFLSTFVSALFQKDIKLLNLKKLSIVNMGFTKSIFQDNNGSFQNELSSVIPNMHKLEELDIRNVTQDCYIFDPAFPEDDFPLDDNELLEFLEDTGYPSLMNFFTNHSTVPQIYENLKKLVFFVNPYLGYIEEVYINENPYLKFNSQLPDFFQKTPNLEELIIFGPQETRLKHIYRMIKQSPVRMTLKNLTYHETQWISKIYSKILNARIYRKFHKHLNLKILNDYYEACSKKLTNHFLITTTVDSYNPDNEIDKFGKNHKDTLFFKEEFLYLFGKDARRFFKICPQLEEFTLYGFTFQKNINILI